MAQYKKLSIHEWLAIQEETNKEWAAKYLIELTQHGKHEGDCTGHGHPCDLCTLSDILREYQQYCNHFVEIAEHNLS